MIKALTLAFSVVFLSSCGSSSFDSNEAKNKRLEQASASSEKSTSDSGDLTSANTTETASPKDSPTCMCTSEENFEMGSMTIDGGSSFPCEYLGVEVKEGLISSGNTTIDFGDGSKIVASDSLRCEAIAGS